MLYSLLLPPTTQSNRSSIQQCKIVEHPTHSVLQAKECCVVVLLFVRLRAHKELLSVCRTQAAAAPEVVLIVCAKQLSRHISVYFKPCLCTILVARNVDTRRHSGSLNKHFLLLGLWHLSFARSSKHWNNTIDSNI